MNREDGDDEARSGVVGVTTPPPGQWPPPPGQSQLGPQPASPRQNDAVKWVLGGLALLVVVVVTVVSTLLITREGGESAGPSPASRAPSTPVDTSDIASADDRAPVGVITEDVTCAAWSPIADTFSAQASKGWNDRDPSIPVTGWTAGQRAQHEAIADAMRVAADETTHLVKLTPHRVMRELYEQSIAYWRAYADAIPTYSREDDHLARVATAASNAVGYVCSAITYGSAASRAPLVPASLAPLEAAPPSDPGNPARYVDKPLSVCADWISAASQFDSDTADWLKTDPNIPAHQWSAEQRAIYERMPSIMGSSAGDIGNLGAQSLNPTFEDFALLASQYRWAFVQSIPTYTPADGYLANVAAELVAANGQACKSVGVQ